MARWEILDIDPYLSDYENDINLRMDRLEEQKKNFLAGGKSLKEFANAHNYYGFHKVEEAGFIGNGPQMQTGSTL